MHKYNLSALKILQFAAFGPAMTIFLIWQGKNYSADSLIAAIIIAVVLVAITAIAALVVRKRYPSETEIAAKTGGISFIAAMIIVAIISCRDPFFVITIIFAPIFSLPTILPFSHFWSKFFGPSIKSN